MPWRARLAVVAGVGALVSAGCGSTSHPAATHRAATQPAASSTATSAPPPTSTTGAPPAPGASGGPVPPGTKATSVTFVSPATAFVLGTAPCTHPPCSVILRTHDRGRSWVGLPAPREAVSSFEGNGLWGLRFADAEHGYAFGNGFWETADGGRSWYRAMAPAPIVLALEAVEDHELVAVAASCRPGRSACAQRLTLYHRPIGPGRWSAVASIRTNLLGASIAVHGSDVWVRALASLYVSTNGGASFAPRPAPCFPRNPGYGMPVSISDAGAHVYLLCAGEGAAGSTLKYVFRAGKTASGWSLAGRPPRTGDAGELSAGSDRAVVIATSSGASWLYRSTDAGHSWKILVTENDGGAGWADLGFTTSADGVVVHGPAVSDGGAGRPGQLLLTDDGGRTWSAVTF